MSDDLPEFNGEDVPPLNGDDTQELVVPAAVTFMLGRIDALSHDPEETKEWKAGWAAACQQMRDAIGWEA